MKTSALLHFIGPLHKLFTINSKMPALCTASSKPTNVQNQTTRRSHLLGLNRHPALRIVQPLVPTYTAAETQERFCAKLAQQTRIQLNNRRKQLACMEAFIEEADKRDINRLQLVGEFPEGTFQKAVKRIEEYRNMEKELDNFARQAMEHEQKAEELWQCAATQEDFKAQYALHLVGKGYHTWLHGRKKQDGTDFGQGGVEPHDT